MISVPAAVVSIFGALLLVYRSRMHWNLVSLLMCFGVMGWAIGGVAAVIDSTVAVNIRFHNTLWVPAHFHTYYLMGVVLMILAFAYHLGQEGSKMTERMGLTKFIVALIVLGGYGFLMMFYYGGAFSSAPLCALSAGSEPGCWPGSCRPHLHFPAFGGSAAVPVETGRRCLRSFSASSASS
jgi:heme/copper-type cytochrome/quinol oxidase subunit 1